MEQLNNPTIEFYSVEHWEENWDELVERVENGEHIGIENENGNKAVMIPADDELIRIHTELNNDAQ
jgi:antitoxin (DNA-binding transcriptional repressor) of toxin-antitoxin stability system